MAARAAGGGRRSRGPSALVVGLIALVIVVIGTFLGFTKDIPFTRGFELKAVFESANNLRPGSPVRIAGVNVGKVKAVQAQNGTNAATVTMEISDQGLPIHKDATAKIRPRIFLEGNFFVDLRPGTPAAPAIDDGYTLRVTQTARPVQLDELLTSLQSDSREDLQDVLQALGTALNREPQGDEDEGVDPSTRGETGAESLNDATDDAAPALRSSAQVAEALLGSQPGADLQRLIRGTSRATAGLARNERQLQDLVSNFNTTMAALGSESANLRTSVRELAPTLQAADGALDALNAAFPATRAFAREILPGVRETPATIEASFPWIEQARALVARDELGGLVDQLSPASRDLARVIDTGEQLLPQMNLAARCATEVLLPTGDVPIRDEFATGVENYKEFFYALVGLAGEGSNFDANGQYTRFQTGGGANTIQLGTGDDAVFGNAAKPPKGTRPAYPGKRPPYRPDVACHRNKRPDLNGPAGQAAAPDKVIRTDP
ncbi:MAG TPA: MlaD family protein [Solirubrobacteraceae bacterium]|jgi:virulence factor Mce-like protein